MAPTTVSPINGILALPGSRVPFLFQAELLGHPDTEKATLAPQTSKPADCWLSDAGDFLLSFQSIPVASVCSGRKLTKCCVGDGGSFQVLSCLREPGVPPISPCQPSPGRGVVTGVGGGREGSVCGALCKSPGRRASDRTCLSSGKCQHGVCPALSAFRMPQRPFCEPVIALSLAFPGPQSFAGSVASLQCPLPCPASWSCRQPPVAPVYPCFPQTLTSTSMPCYPQPQRCLWAPHPAPGSHHLPLCTLPSPSCSALCGAAQHRVCCGTRSGIWVSLMPLPSHTSPLAQSPAWHLLPPRAASGPPRPRPLSAPLPAPPAC